MRNQKAKQLILDNIDVLWGAKNQDPRERDRGKESLILFEIGMCYESQYAEAFKNLPPELQAVTMTPEEVWQEWRETIDRCWELWHRGEGLGGEFLSLAMDMNQSLGFVNGHFGTIEEEEGPLSWIVDEIRYGRDPGLNLPVPKS